MNRDASRPSTGRRPASLKQKTIASLKALGIRAKKGLAQHFLVDEEALQQVVDAGGLTPDDTVIEIGAGLGVLTRELAKHAGKVIAIELDENLAKALSKELAGSSNVTVVHGDVLDINPADLVGADAPYKVVANIPYYITGAILRHFVEAPNKPALVVLMLEKEQAQSVVARPGKMSVLGISVQLYGRPQIVAFVPANSFYPAPKVDSAILRVDIYPRPAVGMTSAEHFFKVVRAGFSARRKQLHNALSRRLNMPGQAVTDVLRRAEIDPMRRAQTLTLEEWARLEQLFAEEKPC